MISRVSSRRHSGLRPVPAVIHRAAMAMRFQGVEQLESRVLLSGEADLYDRWVAIEPTATASVQASAGTLVGELQDMTGRAFTSTATKTTGRGIFVLQAASDLATRYPDLASQQSDLNTLAAKNSEAFFIYSSGSDNLFIVGNSDAAVSMGTYYYLNELGWAALLPGANWTIKPQLSSITLSIDQVVCHWAPKYRQGWALQIPPAQRERDEPLRLPLGRVVRPKEQMVGGESAGDVQSVIGTHVTSTRLVQSADCPPVGH